jgi:hypothetical protein
MPWLAIGVLLTSAGLVAYFISMRTHYAAPATNERRSGQPV